jgi:hypothetical protein
VIDGALVNGSAACVGRLSAIARRVQTGYLYTYAFWMVIGLAALLGWFLLRRPRFPEHVDLGFLSLLLIWLPIARRRRRAAAR